MKLVPFRNVMKTKSFGATCKILLTFVIVLSWISCTKQIETISPIAIDETKPIVSIDSLAVDSVLYPASSALVDSFFVVLNQKKEQALDALSLPTIDCIYSGGFIGRGPDDIPYPNILSLKTFDDSAAYFTTAIPGEVVVVDVPDFNIREKIYYKIPEEWSRPQSLVVIDNERVLAQQGWLPMEWAIIGKDGKIIRKLDINYSDHNIDNEMQQGAMLTGCAAISPDKGRIVITSRSLSLLHIFDLDGELIKTVPLAYDLSAKKVAVMSIQPDSTGFYVDYFNPDQSSEIKSAVFHFDWDGNLINSYNCPYLILTFVPNLKNRKIFFFTESEHDFIYFFEL